MVFYHVVRCGSFCCVPQLGALFGGHLGTTPTSQRAAGEREAGYLKAEWALFGGSLGTLPTSPRATARPLLLPWSFYHGAVGLPWWRAAGRCEVNCLKMEFMLLWVGVWV